MGEDDGAGLVVAVEAVEPADRVGVGQQRVHGAVEDHILPLRKRGQGARAA
jgi:hypothetical protein